MQGQLLGTVCLANLINLGSIPRVVDELIVGNGIDVHIVGTGGHPTGVGGIVGGVIDGVRLDRNVGKVGRGENPVVNVVGVIVGGAIIHVSNVY